MLSSARTSSRTAARALAQAGAPRAASSAIAKKYAQAAYSAALAQSPQTLSKVQTELNAVVASVKSTPALADYISNPTLSVADRASGLQGLLAAAGGSKKEQVSDITKNLFEVMSENGRLVETEGVVEAFAEAVSKYRGELEVIVTSERPLPSDMMKRLETTLKASQTAQKAKAVKVTNKVNPGILGGLIVEFGEKTIDLSVQSRVTRLNALLQESV